MEQYWKDAIFKGLTGVWSFPNPATVLDGVEFDYAGKNAAGLPHTIWQIANHLIEWADAALNEIKNLPVKDFKDTNYFPVESAPANIKDWETLQTRFKELPDKTKAVLESMDETGATSWGLTNTHALLILITHTAYHTAQIVTLQRLLRIYKE